MIGHLMDGFAYIIPDIAYREVVKLNEDGLLIPGNRNLSTQKRVNGRTVRLWRLKGDVLASED